MTGPSPTAPQSPCPLWVQACPACSVPRLTQALARLRPEGALAASSQALPPLQSPLPEPWPSSAKSTTQQSTWADKRKGERWQLLLLEPSIATSISIQSHLGLSRVSVSTQRSTQRLGGSHFVQLMASELAVSAARGLHAFPGRYTCARPVAAVMPPQPPSCTSCQVQAARGLSRLARRGLGRVGSCGLAVGFQAT